MKKNPYLRKIAQYITSVLLLLANPAYGEKPADCDAPLAVCEWRERIVGIKTPNMIASGVLIEGGFIITNRHVVEDHQAILVKSFSGQIDKATVIPHDILVDLAIVSSDPNRVAPDVSKLLAKTESQKLYVVAFDQGRNAARVYKPSNFALYPNLKKYPTARIHSDSRALPGNSGGAVVDQHGMLVGVLASGDHRISEIIPAKNIKNILRSMIVISEKRSTITSFSLSAGLSISPLSDFSETSSSADAG